MARWLFEETRNWEHVFINQRGICESPGRNLARVACLQRLAFRIYWSNDQFDNIERFNLHEVLVFLNQDGSLALTAARISGADFAQTEQKFPRKVAEAYLEALYASQQLEPYDATKPFTSTDKLERHLLKSPITDQKDWCACRGRYCGEGKQRYRTYSN